MGFRVKSSPIRSGKRAVSSDPKDVPQLDDSEPDKKSGFRFASLLSGFFIVAAVAFVVVLVNFAKSDPQVSVSDISVTPSTDDLPSSPTTSSAADATFEAVPKVDEGRIMQAEKTGRERKLPTPSPPFLSDFDTSRPLEKKPPSKVLTREQKQYRRAEAQYQMKLTKRLELMGGKRPDSSSSSRRWKTGRIREVLLSPTYSCARPEQVGDTGLWLCDVKKLRRRGRLNIFSIGTRGNTVWEEAAYKRLKRKVYLFDPKLQSADLDSVKASPYIKHMPYGIGAERQLSSLKRQAPQGQTWRYYPLPRVLSKLNLTHVDVVKIDCEKCEEKMIPEWLEVFGDKPPFAQLSIQVHQVRKVGRTAQVLFPLEDMGYRLFHSEPSADCRTCYKLSFVHHSFLTPSIEAS